MGFLARATAEDFAALEGGLLSGHAVTDLKPPESGLIMLRGRMGGDGAPFNLGEASMTRAVVEIDGKRGYGYRLRREAALARDAAIADALWQNPVLREAVERLITNRVEQRLAEAAALKASETAATRVDFFTLVRGD
jgi:alpha-D-ribose 1-methylphosphonate 5-triphosphate synthase subunit PhnG